MAQKQDDILYVIDVSNNFDFSDRANNLLLNLLGGLNPANLNEDEIECLQRKFGKNILNKFNN